VRKVMTADDIATPALPRHRKTLDELGGRDPSRGILLSGAVVISMDAQVGDYESADILINGSTITAVGPDLRGHPGATGAVVVDCSGLIIAPGFHDTHRHAWQNQLRRYIVDEDLDGYMEKMHARMAHHYRPEDMYAGNLVSALGALDSGVTTILDFSHNSRSSGHSDAAIAAWDQAGIRAVHASAAPFDGEWDEQWPADLDRLAANLPSSGLVSLRMALLPKVYEMIPDILALSQANLELARRIGISVSVDGFFGPPASREVERLVKDDVLGEDITYIHCTDLTDAAWEAIHSSGGHVSLAPTSDAQVGICSGLPPVQKCMDLGIEPSIGVDVECCLSSDMFSQMRALLTIQRMNVFTRRYTGDQDPPSLLTDRQVLRMATIAGARANGLEESSGSISPGKEADLIALRADDINVFPLNNAVATIVQGADSRNIECVFVAGRPVKWQGSVLSFDLDEARGLATRSRDYLFSQAGVKRDILA
jgi:cytosine/adenosine deaminase-related metal-dependent hydrolase